jgi:signal peptidase I
MQEAGWPSRWFAATPQGWQSFENGGYFLPRQPSRSWLRYRHLIPRRDNWIAVGRGQPLRLDDSYGGHLITDYYAYNDPSLEYDDIGNCWVGDLALECDVEVQGSEGELVLDLVEGGVHYTCTFDVSTGQAKLAIEHGQPFVDAAGNSCPHPAAATPLRGAGRHRLRFANVDDQLHLWVNDHLAAFDGPTTFHSAPDLAPQWSPQDPGDLNPVGLAARGLELRVHHLRVLRDVYYRAVSNWDSFGTNPWGEEHSGADSEYRSTLPHSDHEIHEIMSHPERWGKTDLFASRRSVTFQLGEDQFFPLGDNSPQSKDARLWSSGWHGGGLDPPPYVDRDLLIGRALAIYWPHGWRVGTDWVGIIPNFQRLGLIR